MGNEKENVVLISFFKSENIGDIELSKELLKIVEKKHEVKSIYDFSTLNKIIIKDENKTTNETMNDYGFKRWLKNIILLTLGRKNYRWLTYHRIVKKNILMGLFKEIEYCQRVIIGGGNMLMDRDKTWPLRMKKIIDHCYKNKIKVDIVYVGAGPIPYPSTERIYKEIFDKIETLMVRDYRSKSLLMPYVESKKIHIDYDPALFYNQEKYKTRLKSIESKKNITLGINVIGEECFPSQLANDKYLRNMYELINCIDEDSVEQIILFSTAEKDYININKLISNISNSKVTIYNIKDYDDIVELYSKLSFLVGGRMHSLIFAQSMFLPYIALAWDNKVYGYL